LRDDSPCLFRGHVERPWQAGEVYRLRTGVTVHGVPCGGRWVYYAGVWDEAAGAWLNPQTGVPEDAALHVTVDGRETHLVPLFTVRNCWGNLAVRQSLSSDNVE